MALIAIPANDIDTAGLSVDAALPATWIEQQLEELRARVSEPGQVSVRLSRSGGEEIVVHGKVRAKVVLECARCLGDAPVDVDSELALLLQPVAPAARVRVGKAPPERILPHRERGRKPDAEPVDKAPKKAPKKQDVEYEFSSEEADVDSYDGETVVLDDFVREAILLEMPIFPLCSESCPGIGAAASTASPPSEPARINPRLAPLGALRAKLEQGAVNAKGRSSPPASTAKTSTQKKKTKKE